MDHVRVRGDRLVHSAPRGTGRPPNTRPSSGEHQHRGKQQHREHYRYPGDPDQRVSHRQDSRSHGTPGGARRHVDRAARRHPVRHRLRTPGAWRLAGPVRRQPAGRRLRPQPHPPGHRPVLAGNERLGPLYRRARRHPVRHRRRPRRPRRLAGPVRRQPERRRRQPQRHPPGDHPRDAAPGNPGTGATGARPGSTQAPGIACPGSTQPPGLARPCPVDSPDGSRHRGRRRRPATMAGGPPARRRSPRRDRVRSRASRRPRPPPQGRRPNRLRPARPARPARPGTARTAVRATWRSKPRRRPRSSWPTTNGSSLPTASATTRSTS